MDENVNPDYPLKRMFDLTISSVALIFFSPLIGIALLAVWLQDRHSPFYYATRVGRNNKDFTMIKVRSMIVRAETSGVNSTGADDDRITRVGHLIRKAKIDELSQFFNVLRGDMSAVGPRPNTRHWGIDLYTDRELTLLLVNPGITDLSSIIFSDEGDILEGAENPDLLYNQVIRPWKNRLALWYIENMSLRLDIRICWVTALAIISKKRAIDNVVALLEKAGADPELIEVCRRTKPLPAAIPPGGTEIEQGVPVARPMSDPSVEKA